ncbi:MAG: hypothetical protein GY754_29930 [bacterium]|nr:hypothetical protein [bacterium]
MKKKSISGLMLPVFAIGFCVSIFLLNTTQVTAVSPTAAMNACRDANNRIITKQWVEVKGHLYAIHSFNDTRQSSDGGTLTSGFAGNPVLTDLTFPQADPQGKGETPPHRATFHTTLNEVVFPHSGGSWECLYGALIVPFTEIEGRVYKGNEQDLMLWNTTDPSRVGVPLNILMVAPPTAFLTSKEGNRIGFRNSFNRLAAANNITRINYFPHWTCTCADLDPNTGKTRQLHRVPGCHSTAPNAGNNVPGYTAGNKESLRQAVERTLIATYNTANNRPWFFTRCNNCGDNTRYTTARRFGNIVWRYPPYKKIWVTDPQNPNNCAWEVAGVPDWYDGDIRVHAQSKLGKLDQKKLPKIDDLNTKWTDADGNTNSKLDTACRKTYSQFPYQKKNRLIREHVDSYNEVENYIRGQDRYTVQQKTAYTGLLDDYTHASLTYAFVSECRCYAKEDTPNAANAKKKCQCAFYDHAANGMRQALRDDLPTNDRDAISLPKKSSNRRTLFRKVMSVCRRCYWGGANMHPSCQ